MSVVEFCACALWLAMPFVAMVFWYRRVARKLEQQSVLHIRAYKSGHEVPAALDGANAEVLKTSRSYYPRHGEAENFTVTQILRSPAGIYFMVKAGPNGVHFCKVLQETVLAQLLGRKGGFVGRSK